MLGVTMNANMLDFERIERVLRGWSEGGLGPMGVEQIAHHLGLKQERVQADLEAMGRVVGLDKFGRGIEWYLIDHARAWGWSKDSVRNNERQ